MQISIHIKGKIYFVDLEGALEGESVAQIKKHLNPVLDGQHFDAMVFNFEKVNFIDSSGLGLIVRVFKELRHQEQKMGVVNLSEKVRSVFEMTSLNMIVEIYKNEEEAIAALS